MATYPDGATESFRYDAFGNRIESTDRRGQSTGYVFGDFDLPTQIQYADGSVSSFSFDSRGNLLTATDARGTVTSTYDGADRFLSIAYPSGRSLDFAYDAGGRRIESVDQDGFTIRYSYNSLGQLVGLEDGGGSPIVAYAYDAVGRLARKDLGNDAYTVYEYDAASRLTHLVNHAPDGSVSSRFDYGYDALDRRTSVTTLQGTWLYEYDPMGRLAGVEAPDGGTVEYFYDAAGNRTAVVDDGSTTRYTVNNLDQYTRWGDFGFTYDAEGNLIGATDGTTTTTRVYDERNRLTSLIVSDPSTTTTGTYQYDVFGDRIAVTRAGQRREYLIDPTGFANVVAEYDGSGSLVARYVHGLGLVSRIDADGSVTYYDFDAVGSAVGLTDATGSYVNRYEYTPFGLAVSSTEAVPNRFRFVGELGVMDEGNGLLFMRNRYYSTDLGRFTSQDPLRIPALGLYTYAENSPLQLVDPEGLDGFGFMRGISNRTNAMNRMMSGDDSAFNDYNNANQQISNNANGFINQLGDQMNYTSRPSSLSDLKGPFDLLNELLCGARLGGFGCDPDDGEPDPGRATQGPQ